ncbi:hypothetical protein DSM104299_00398 [Baekduia alba]|nr:hypothetical protein DSM104299_00398 [Baekduia alba]
MYDGSYACRPRVVIIMMTCYVPVIMMMTSQYDPAMMDPEARAPDPHLVTNYSTSYSNEDYLSRTDPLTMLRVNDNMRIALRAYDERCVAVARRAGATWEEIGQAVGMAKQNAQRKWSHVG